MSGYDPDPMKFAEGEQSHEPMSDTADQNDYVNIPPGINPPKDQRIAELEAKLADALRTLNAHRGTRVVDLLQDKARLIERAEQAEADRDKIIGETVAILRKHDDPVKCGDDKCGCMMAPLQLLAIHARERAEQAEAANAAMREAGETIINTWRAWERGEISAEEFNGAMEEHIDHDLTQALSADTPNPIIDELKELREVNTGLWENVNHLRNREDELHADNTRLRGIVDAMTSECEKHIMPPAKGVGGNRLPGVADWVAKEILKARAAAEQAKETP